MGCNLGLIVLGICIVIAAFLLAPATTVTLIVNAIVSVIFYLVIAVAIIVFGIIAFVALASGPQI